MSLTLKPAKTRRLKNAVKHGVFTTKGLTRLMRLTFMSGPWILFTSRLSKKSASIMILLCLPALLFSAMLTIPAMLFQSPEQHSYYQFAQSLDQDPIRWVILAVTGICAVISLAVPATAPKPMMAIRR